METDVQIAKSIENSELKEIIVRLREQMDVLSFSKDAAVQKAVQRSSDEIQQLKNNLKALRKRIEDSGQ